MTIGIESLKFSSIIFSISGEKMKGQEDVLQNRGLVSKGFYLPYNPDLVERARHMRKQMTDAEKKLWFGFLRNFRYRVLRQRPIDHFIVDFYCPKLRLVIEIDGDLHFSKDGIKYDAERTNILTGYGLRVVRFSNRSVLSNFKKVCKRIEGIPPPRRGQFG